MGWWNFTSVLPRVAFLAPSEPRSALVNSKYLGGVLSPESQLQFTLVCLGAGLIYALHPPCCCAPSVFLFPPFNSIPQTLTQETLCTTCYPGAQNLEQHCPTELSGLMKMFSILTNGYRALKI